MQLAHVSDFAGGSDCAKLCCALMKPKLISIVFKNTDQVENLQHL